MIDRQEWADLPGQIEVQRADGVFGEVSMFRAVHSIGSYKYSAMLPVSSALLEDSPYLPAVEEHVAEGLDKHIRPWAYPDRVQWPHWEPFPRWQRFIQHGLHKARSQP